MKAMVTGAGGFIGSHVVDFLLHNGHHVLATTRPGGHDINLRNALNLYDPHLALRAMNVRDATLVENIIKSYKPDIIFHFAAQSQVQASCKEPIYTLETNVLGTTNICETVANYCDKCKIIVAGSSASYGQTSTDSLTWSLRENNLQQPVHPYGVSKMAAEWMAKQYYLNYGIDTRVIRYFNQTGPRKTGDACSDFARAVAKIKLGMTCQPVIKVGNLDKIRDITGIQDTVRGTMAVGDRGRAGESYNLCSGYPTSIRTVLEKMIAFSGMKIEVEENCDGKVRTIDEAVILGDNTKIKYECGYSPRQKQDDLFRSMYEYWVNFYRENGDLSP